MILFKRRTVTYEVAIWEDNVEEEVEKGHGKDYGEGS